MLNDGNHLTQIKLDKRKFIMSILQIGQVNVHNVNSFRFDKRNFLMSIPLDHHLSNVNLQKEINLLNTNGTAEKKHIIYLTSLCKGLTEQGLGERNNKNTNFTKRYKRQEIILKWGNDVCRRTFIYPFSTHDNYENKNKLISLKNLFRRKIRFII